MTEPAVAWTVRIKVDVQPMPNLGDVALVRMSIGTDNRTCALSRVLDDDAPASRRHQIADMLETVFRETVTFLLRGAP